MTVNVIYTEIISTHNIHKFSLSSTKYYLSKGKRGFTIISNLFITMGLKDAWSFNRKNKVLQGSATVPSGIYRSNSKDTIFRKIYSLVEECLKKYEWTRGNVFFECKTSSVKWILLLLHTKHVHLILIWNMIFVKEPINSQRTIVGPWYKNYFNIKTINNTGNKKYWSSI